MYWRVTTRPGLAALSLLALAALSGCTASTASQSTSVGAAAGTPSSSAGAPAPPAPAGRDLTPSVLAGAVLLVDRGDLRLGTTVQFSRVPSSSELHDAAYQLGLARILIVLDTWPDYGTLQPLDQSPEGIEVVAVLPGYPPSRGAAEAWGLVNRAVRVIVVVSGPPPSRGEIDDLNQMRGLDRVIARMSEPSRAGFERLQRPLSFWTVVE